MIRKSEKTRYRTRIGIAVLIGLILITAYSNLNRYSHNKIETILHGRKDVEQIPKDVAKALSNPPSNVKPVTNLRVPILLYHYVEYVTDLKDTKRMSLNIQPLTFEKQVETLSENGYTFITPSELTLILAGRKTAPPKPVILSFDDGYRDFYIDVLPILKKHNAKAVLYVVTSFVNLTRNFLTTEQLKEIRDTGLVEIGAHTVHHYWLKNLNPDLAKKEIENSRKQLSELLNLNILSFAYPYGAFDTNTIGLVKNAGYTNAVSTVPGIEQNIQNEYFLYRIRPGYRWGEELLSYLENFQQVNTAGLK